MFSESFTPNPSKFPASSRLGALIAIIFMVLAGTALAIGGFVIWRTREENTTLNTLTIPHILSNCAAFYQLCPTSRQGVTSTHTVRTLFETQQLAIRYVQEISFPTPAQPQGFTTPDYVLTYLSSEKNLNPFLLLALSEVMTQTPSQGKNLEKPLLPDSETTGYAAQFTQVADELVALRNEFGLLPDQFNQPNPTKRITAFDKTLTVHDEASLASVVVAEWFKRHSQDLSEFQQRLLDFPAAYERVAGISPTSLAPEPTPFIPADLGTIIEELAAPVETDQEQTIE